MGENPGHAEATLNLYAAVTHNVGHSPQPPTSFDGRPRTPDRFLEGFSGHSFLHGMEEVRSSILLSSTHSNAALLRWCRICGFGFFVGLVWFGDISARYELRERGLWAEAAVS